jgi:hypothetical protein
MHDSSLIGARVRLVVAASTLLNMPLDRAVDPIIALVDQALVSRSAVSR